MKLLLKNGYIVDPGQNLQGKYDLLIEKGRIKAIEKDIKTDQNVQIIDLSGLYISPGFIDLHTHLREPGFENKETILSGSRAAVHGGFTSIACMANTNPVNDNRSVTEYIIARAGSANLAKIMPVAAVSKGMQGDNLVEMADLVAGGAVAFSDDGNCVMKADLIRKALEYSRMFNVPIIEHPEDHSISAEGQVNEGFISYKYGLRGILNAAEEVIVARDIILMNRIQAKLHLTHISTRGSVELIRHAKKNGSGITCDATPHHLLLNEEYLKDYNPVYKVKPPLRTEEDRIALLEAIADGTIDCIASDHAPHTRDEKDKEFEYAPFGVIGLETTFSVIYDRLVRTEIISLSRLVELLATNPARILNLQDRGSLKTGNCADLTILDLEKEFLIDSQNFYSLARNCPFNGWQGKGVVAYTIVDGRVVYDYQKGIVS